MTSGAPVLPGLGGVLLFLAAGSGLVELLPAFRERPLAARFGWSYLFGVAAVAGTTYLLGIAFDVRIRRGVVLAPVVALLIAGLLARALRGGPARTRRLRPPRAGVFASRAAFGASAVIATGLFAAALTIPAIGFDGEMTWNAAARWVRADRSVLPRVFVDPRTFVSHPRYPILMPLAQVFVQEAFDLDDDRRAVKPLYAAFFPALLLVSFDLSRRHAGTFAAALATLGLAAVPVLVECDFGGADGTFSDVPLAAFLGCGFLLLLGRPRISEAAASGLLLGAAVLTKNEGLPFACAALAAVAFLAYLDRPPRRRRRLDALGLAACVVFAAGLALRAWRSHIPERWDENYSGRLATVSLVTEARARLPLLPGALVKETANREYLAGFGLVAVVILASGARGLRRRIVPSILLALYFYFGAYVLALLLSTWPGVEQVRPTWYRFLIVLSLPVGVLLALALRAGWRGRFRGGGSAIPHRDASASRAIGERSTARARNRLVFLGFALFPVVCLCLLAAYGRLQASRERRAAARRIVIAPVILPWKEDASLTGGLDAPAEGVAIRGQLEVRGWARTPGQNLRVIVLVDGKPRSPSASGRRERPDVQGALPSLGDCSKAGFELSYPFSPADAGLHELSVVFRTQDGRERHYPARQFVWNP